MSDSLVEHLENWSEQDLPAASQTEQQVTTFDWNTLMFWTYFFDFWLVFLNVLNLSFWRKISKIDEWKGLNTVIALFYAPLGFRLSRMLRNFGQCRHKIIDLLFFMTFVNDPLPIQRKGVHVNLLFWCLLWWIKLQTQIEETQSAGSSESNPSSGQASESIYDKYSARSPDQEEGDVMEVKSLEDSRKNPIGKTKI